MALLRDDADARCPEKVPSVFVSRAWRSAARHLPFLCVPRFPAMLQDRQNLVPNDNKAE